MMEPHPLAPSPALEDALRSLSYVALTEAYMDTIATMAWTGLDTSLIDDAAVRSQIERIDAACATTLEVGKQVAALWSAPSGGNEPIRDQEDRIATTLKSVAEEWSTTAQNLANTADHDKPELVQGLAQQCLEAANTIGALRESIDKFAERARAEASDFDSLYDRQRALSTSLTSFHDELDKKLNEFQIQLDALNDNVLKKAFETGYEELKEGFVAVTAAAEENAGEFGKAAGTMIFKGLKFEIEGIELESEALDLLHQIFRLTDEIHEVDVAMLRLRDLGSQLQTIQGRNQFSITLADRSYEFLLGASEQLELAASGQLRSADWAAAGAAWKAFGDKVANIRAKQIDALPIWHARSFVQPATP